MTCRLRLAASALSAKIASIIIFQRVYDISVSLPVCLALILLCRVIVQSIVMVVLHLFLQLQQSVVVTVGLRRSLAHAKSCLESRMFPATISYCARTCVYSTDWIWYSFWIRYEPTFSLVLLDSIHGIRKVRLGLFVAVIFQY